MAHSETKRAKHTGEPRCVGAIAVFDTPGAALRAAERVRDAGYKRWDVYSPYPLHGIDDIMQRPTILPWLCAGGAVVGLCTALGLQYWANGIEGTWFLSGYQFLASGKQYFALPSTAPIDFELTILLTAITCFFSVLFLSGLPRLYNPLFRSEDFRKGVTNDKIVVGIEALDPKFSRGKTSEFLANLHAARAEDVYAPVESSALPRPIVLGLIILAILALIPPFLIIRARSTFGDQPRIHIVQDMDFQPKFKAQKRNPFFADGRADRPPVSGTVAVGELFEDDRYYKGIDPSGAPGVANASFQEPETPATPARSAPADAAQANPAPEAAEPKPADPNAVPAANPAQPVDTTPWVKEFPAPIIEKLRGDASRQAFMARAQERFNIYCSACHGLEGDGNGLVALRATELEQSTWVKPSNMHDDAIVQQPVGKLFGTISNGIRKMPGYAQQISVEDRWAIVFYVKALQRSRNASASDVPADILGTLENSK